VNPCITRVIPERFRDYVVAIKCYTNPHLLYLLTLLCGLQKLIFTEFTDVCCCHMVLLYSNISACSICVHCCPMCALYSVVFCFLAFCYLYIYNTG